MRDPWRLAALALGASLAWQYHRAQRAEAKVTQLEATGAVDLEPLLVVAEGMVDALVEAGGLRPSRSEVRRSGASLVAVPSAP